MPPPSKISSCSSGIAFWVTQVGWQFLFTLILGGNICFWAKYYLEKSFRVPFLRQGSFFKSNERNISEATELCEGSKEGFLRMANITRPFQGVWHMYFMCIHVKYTCYTSGNGLAMLAILENPNFDPSHNSVASEIFLSLILKNDPCLRNGTLKLFLGNFWPWRDNNLIIYVQIWIVITSGPLKSQSLMHRSWFG